MSSNEIGFAADFCNAFHPFTTKEFEDLILGIPPTNRLRKSVWEWLTANGPHPTISLSPPALGNLLSAPDGSSDHPKPTPAASSAFYSFLNGEVDPTLLNLQTTSSLHPKRVSKGPYFLCPCNG
ncbi:hypothetical protein O181_092450 [Austropuccinia psidii MF-1]|uniref:Uncharacterized protein n=1 Tax=Austropuccinia psidii MF-1 TaxID=1389203 RepID=A0A9Q3IYL2_9BASI|nr:hypothetical protein [Austropuccinia psidii MF-1]